MGLVVLALAFMDGRTLADGAPAPGRGAEAAFGKEPITPLPRKVDADPAKVALGRRLFFDARLSHDNSLSCASCHDLARGGADGRARAIGIGGSIGPVHTPTVVNAAFNFRQFWDGRAGTLEEQAAGPVHNPKEMASAWPEVVAKLSDDPDYRTVFARLYRDGIGGPAIQDAIAAFERTLVTPDSRFDRYLRGDKAALSEREAKGYQRFKDLGCAACHQGVNVGGNLYESLGIFGNYFADRGGEEPADQGRFNVTGREQDRHRFKVPSLRNVALTAPYFHDGSVRELRQAIRLMGRYQLGLELTDGEIALIEAFLGTLTGTYEGKPL